LRVALDQLPAVKVWDLRVAGFIGRGTRSVVVEAGRSLVSASQPRLREQHFPTPTPNQPPLLRGAAPYKMVARRARYGRNAQIAAAPDRVATRSKWFRLRGLLCGSDLRGSEQFRIYADEGSQIVASSFFSIRRQVRHLYSRGPRRLLQPTTASASISTR